MIDEKREIVVPKEKFDAVIFDMDGVVTDTAGLHGEAWKLMFDGFLEAYAKRHEQKQPLFDLDQDYRLHVDGKPRFDGVRDFLASRGITLPEGELDDPPGTDTVHALGNWKNDLFHELLDRKGAVAYPGTVKLLHELHRAGIGRAIISSSKNAVKILKSAGVLDLFEAKVDGLDSLKLGIPGKPAPNIFLEAAKALKVRPERAVVVEDAISGVQAGRSGGFGLVIGVDRIGNPEALRSNGADVVVSDLAEVNVV
ncbi:MAG TPA: beta-phosphoglucomutase family hydrolase [Desulfonatronum sp.]|nr:beta-phosphoglucomutase family hydrolase [Desulfonatronum sp.]